MNARSVRLYYACYSLLTASHRAILLSHTFVRACFAGFWLGLLKRDSLIHIGDLFYAAHERYGDDHYNLQGLWAWEAAMLERFFSGERLLLVGAGGGRETVALEERGYSVTSFECNPKLVEGANALLGRRGLSARIELAPPDLCPPTGFTFDGLVVGWGAYMLIQGRDRRVALLRSMRAQTLPGRPLLLSFFVRDPTAKRFTIIKIIGTALRRLFWREPVELGDDLEPEYVHYFTQDELAAELEVADFELAYFGAQPYGHAVAFAR